MQQYQREPVYGPINRDFPPETAVMDPYTVQITNRLGEADKQVSDLMARVYRLNDKLFGPSTTLGKLDPTGRDAPTPKAMMEQIVGQSNILCRKLADLSEALNRLESL